MMRNTEDAMKNYAGVGMAALLPGMLYMAEMMRGQLEELMEQQVDLVRAEIARLNGEKPPKAAKAAPVKPKSGHPRDAKHPDHAAWLAKLRRGHKKHWKTMTPAKRKAQITAMLSGRKQVTNGVAAER